LILLSGNYGAIYIKREGRDIISRIRNAARRLLPVKEFFKATLHVIAEHVNSVNPTVLISPSLNTGLDLKDELSRLQIIVKVPYPDLSDRWIKAKKDSDQSWYIWQTVLELEQAYGRSVRSKQDYADTYILDSRFLYFLNKNRSMFADWFVEALR
jgi:ATP-dependent DNA helicase DinG